MAEMTASGFDLARVPPLLGRPLLESDEVEGAPAVLVIVQDEWRRDFGVSIPRYSPRGFGKLPERQQPGSR